MRLAIKAPLLTVWQSFKQTFSNLDDFRARVATVLMVTEEN